MSAAIVVTNPLPTSIVALQVEVVEQVATLTAEAKALVVQDVASLETGNALFRRIDTLKKAIENGRLDITRPIDEFKKAIMEAQRSATVPLDEARADLGKRLMTCQKELDRIRAEAEAKARAEAEAKAKAERDRLEAERQALIAKQKAEHEAALKAAEEARAKAQAEADEAAALFGDTAPEVPPVVVAPPAPPEPPPVVIIPVVERPAALSTPMPKAAVRTTVRRVLRIVDAAAIPREIGGAVLMVPDEKVIKKLLESGIAVPGCRLESVEGMASAGGR